MRLSLVFGVIGNLLRFFALAFIPPLLLALVDGDTAIAQYFALAAAASLGAGWLLARSFEPTRFLYRPEALAVVAGTWLVIAAFGGIPYVLTGMSPVNAFFESMSGFTTTGATILADFGVYGENRAFFLWRAMTQWFGGLGVIALFVVVLPRLGIAGRQLFFAEACDAPSEGISPRVRTAAQKLWILYSFLTVLLCGLLMTTGFSLYEGVVHALTTMSAGGFSPHGASIAGYANPAAEWIFVVFMFLAGASYTLQVVAVSGRPQAMFRDSEFLAYGGFAVVASLALAWSLGGGSFDPDAIRTSFFQITSLGSSTGYASANFELWTQDQKAILIVAMIVGGCAGSAAGGAKVIRWVVLLQFLRREMRQGLHPRAVMPMRYKGRKLSDSVLRAVLMVVLLYAILALAVGVAVTCMDDCTLEEGMTAGLSCTWNVGPAFGRAGPMDNFDHFKPATKVLLTLTMWLGRLEILAVFLLLHPDAWRNTRWGGRRAT